MVTFYVLRNNDNRKNPVFFGEDPDHSVDSALDGYIMIMQLGVIIMHS